MYAYTLKLYASSQKYLFRIIQQYFCILLSFFSFLDVKLQVEENNEVKNLTVKLVDVNSYKDKDNANSEVNTLFRATVISF